MTADPFPRTAELAQGTVASPIRTRLRSSAFATTSNVDPAMESSPPTCGHRTAIRPQEIGSLEELPHRGKAEEDTHPDQEQGGGVHSP